MCMSLLLVKLQAKAKNLEISQILSKSAFILIKFDLHLPSFGVLSSLVVDRFTIVLLMYMNIHLQILH